MTNNATFNSPIKRKIASLDKRKARSGWFFILPFLIGFILIYLPIIFDSIKMSFTEIVPGTNNDRFFVWFDNYGEALFGYTAADKRTFLEVLIDGLLTLAFELPSILIVSLFMAVMLNQKGAGRGLFRAIFFIPVIISTGIMEQIAESSMSQTMGEAGIDDGSGEGASDGLVSALDFEVLFASLGSTGITEYVTTAVNSIFGIVNRSGVQMLIFLAGLQSVSPAIYESCKIDGATAWETFWKITFPMISPMILVNGIYTIIDSFTVNSNPVMQFIKAADGTATDGVRSAMSWIYFLVVMLIVALIAGVLSAFVFYQRKND